MPVTLTSADVQQLAHACGFEIAGVAAADPHPDFARFQSWRHAGNAADLAYLTDHRGDLRSDPKLLLPTAQSIICLGKLYNTAPPSSPDSANSESGIISRYAWGLDYHETLRPALKRLLDRLAILVGRFDSKICIDTAPLLERSFARAAGLGWIGRNTCLINQHHGSWFFLAELLVAIPITPDAPVPDRCGSCTRCIQACPTDALVPNPDGGFDLDARLCISYLTIEKRGLIPDDLAARHGAHIFGCDICQDVCPWNHRAYLHGADSSTDPSFAARISAPDLTCLSTLQEDDFRQLFRHTPVWRAKYAGFLRNVAIAMANSGREAMREPLQRLAHHPHPDVSDTARQGLQRLEALLLQLHSTARHS